MGIVDGPVNRLEHDISSGAAGGGVEHGGQPVRPDPVTPIVEVIGGLEQDIGAMGMGGS